MATTTAGIVKDVVHNINDYVMRNIIDGERDTSVYNLKLEDGFNFLLEGGGLILLEKNT
jgi:hypothetical protein